MKTKFILFLFSAFLFSSCSKSSLIEGTTWYGGTYRLTFGYSTVTIETYGTYTYGYPKVEGTYSAWTYPDISLHFNTYYKSAGKHQYLTGSAGSGKVEGNTLTFHWADKDWVFVKKKN